MLCFCSKKACISALNNIVHTGILQNEVKSNFSKISKIYLGYRYNSKTDEDIYKKIPADPSLAGQQPEDVKKHENLFKNKNNCLVKF